MRTTLNLNEEIILQVMSFTEMKNKSQAVNKVLEEYVRKKKKQALLKRKGTLHLEDNWKQIRKMEVDEK